MDFRKSVLAFMFIVLLVPFASAGLNTSVLKDSRVEVLNPFERLLAGILDHGISMIPYEFSKVELLCDTSATSEISETNERASKFVNSIKLRELSLGKTLIMNAKVYREAKESSAFLCAIHANVTIDGEAAGQLRVRWRPSESMLSLMVRMGLYALDRAYPWPEWILQRFPQWFRPQAHSEPFELEWHEVDQLLFLTKPHPELEFVLTVLNAMKMLEPTVSELTLHGLVTHFGVATSNQTMIVFDINSDFEGALRCEQKIVTNINFFSQKKQFVRGRVNCAWPDNTSELKGVPLD